MFLPKSAFLFSLLAVSHVAVASLPPACLLDAVGAQPNPADLATICGPNASKVESQISSACGGNAQAALNTFSSTCASAGHKIAPQTSAISSSSMTPTASASGSSSASVTVSFTPVRSGFSTAVATGSASGIANKGSSNSTINTPAPPSGSNVPLSTGAASSNRQVSAAAFAAVVFIGFAASL